eukprot:TRINITY_DN22577_c0_g1_i1.p1 TRINITY_DN22577_c0_g1~~TRINITY_DN22577_c0_g1_i1.p1  ORF type:complete len:422 (-),score=79.49 TRINITY_DN22577_c0_g1_i1:302-1567(-)
MAPDVCMDINKKLIKASSKGGICAILAIVSEKVMYMNGVNLSTALHRIAKSCASPKTEPAPALEVNEVHAHPGFRLLLQRIRLAAEASVRQSQHNTGSSNLLLPTDSIGIIVWSLACLNIQDLELLDSLAKLAVRDLTCFRPFQAVNVIWGFAKLGVAKQFPRLFHETFMRVHSREPGSFSPHSLAMAAWVFTKAELCNQEVFESLEAELRPQSQQLNAQALADVCWALAEQKIALPREISLALVADAILDRMDDEQLCNVLSATMTSSATNSNTRRNHPELLHKLGLAALKLLQDMAPSHLSIVVSAYADNQAACPELIPSLFSAIAEKAPSFSTQELVEVTQHAARGYPFNKSVLDSLGSCTILRLPEFERPDLAALATAFRLWEDDDYSAGWVVDAISDERNSHGYVSGQTQEVKNTD